MNGENDNPSKDKKDLLESDDTNKDELDGVLGDDKKDEKDNKKDDPSDKKVEGDDKEKPDNFLKKVGTREFTSEEDYDKFVADQYQSNSRMAGEIKKLGGDPKEKSEPKEEDDTGDDKDNPKDKKLSDADKAKLEENESQRSYYRHEGIKFSKEFPIAKDYKEEMNLAIKKNKANVGGKSDGEPSFAVALYKSLKADGKEIPEKLTSRIKSEMGKYGDVESSRSAQKKVMRSGGRGGNTEPEQSDSPYQSQEEFDDFKDFTNKLASGN